MNLPAEPRHQRYADLRLRGLSTFDAYIGAGYKAKRQSAQHAAKRLEKRKDIRDYMQAIKEQAADATCLSVLEIRQFCARIVRTPITKLDVEKEADSDLIKSYSKTETELSNSIRLEKLDPLKAIEIDMKLSGDDPETNAQSQLAAAIASLAPASALPEGKM